ncbi:MAG TPA: ATP-binding protein [Phycisphaerae bacterium]|nr:ATP-binding protein [Phycisphaerae bacterium]
MKKAPRRMRREYERLARMNQLAEMGKLAAGLAHELKNPLSTLKLNLQLLEEDLGALPDTPEFAGRRRSIARIDTLKKEADRLRQTLDDFLRFAGRIELRTNPVPLNRVLEELIDFIHPQAQAQRVRVLTAFAPENPVCPLDENLFKQAVLNLLLNAIQAMSVERPSGDGEPGPRGGGELLVRTLVSKGKEGDQAILYISDTGVGISHEHLPHIFDAYFTTKKGGTGLGLPTTRRIIEEHHGLISVQSEPGKGTSFRVELPLVASAAGRGAGGVAGGSV